jgi:uncharacterized protein
VIGSVIMPLAGGMLVGLGLALLLLARRSPAGVSGVLGGLLPPVKGDAGWRVAFIAGLALGGVVLGVLAPGTLGAAPDQSLLVLGFAGLLVGLGTRLGGGCTSGHGVCGTSRLSPRSIAATLTFIATGALTVYAVEHLIRGGL